MMMTTKRKAHSDPGIEGGYALDFISVIRHVATKLDEAPDGLSVGELAAGYRGFPADLGRVQHHHTLPTERAAVTFLMERAVLALGNQLQSEDREGIEVWRLARPFNQLRYERRSIARVVSSKLGDPFNPLKDGWAVNVRHNPDRDDLTELIDSMREFGWLPEFPAIQDERGVILVGHRRLKVADQLGIEPQVKSITFGQGDEADARRAKLAIASNIGAKPLTPTDRAAIAEYLYEERGWTMTRIGEALRVSTMQISRDLASCNPGLKPPRPKGGRPKGSGGRSKRTPENQSFVEANHVAFGGTMTGPEIQSSLGISKGTFDQLKGDVEAKLRHVERQQEERQQTPPASEASASEPHCPTCTCAG